MSLKQEFEFVSVEVEEDEKQLTLQVALSPSDDGESSTDPLSVKEEVVLIPSDDGSRSTDPLSVKEEISMYSFAGDTIKDPLFIKAEAHTSREIASPELWNGQIASKFQQIVLPKHTVESKNCTYLQTSSGTQKLQSEVMQEGAPLQTFTCDRCSAVFMSKYMITNHVFHHINGLLPPSHICIVCGEVFDTFGCLRKHLRFCSMHVPRNFFRIDHRHVHKGLKL